MTRCAPCGLNLPDAPGPVHAYMTASCECWAMFGGLMARDYSDPAYQPHHRMLVDAYAAQHSIGDDRRARQSHWIHGAALVAQFDLGWPGPRVVELLRKGAENAPEYDHLAAPDPGDTTIEPIFIATDPIAHGRAVETYARGVHDNLSPHHGAFRGLIQELSA